jgi:hypothetical protein
MMHNRTMSAAQVRIGLRFGTMQSLRRIECRGARGADGEEKDY